MVSLLQKLSYLVLQIQNITLIDTECLFERLHVSEIIHTIKNDFQLQRALSELVCYSSSSLFQTASNKIEVKIFV